MEEIKSEQRELYYVIMRCDMPYEGTITVAATDAEHARTLVTAQFEERKNLKIVDIFAESQLPPIPELDHLPDVSLGVIDAPTKKLN